MVLELDKDRIIFVLFDYVWFILCEYSVYSLWTQNPILTDGVSLLLFSVCLYTSQVGS